MRKRLLKLTVVAAALAMLGAVYSCDWRELQTRHEVGASPM